MNSLHLLLLDLLRIAETPVYSAFRWLGRELGHPIALPEFVQLVDDLLGKDAIQLWSIDADMGEAKQLRALPPNLATRYAELGHADGSFDPLGLSLTVGPAAEPDVEADWEFDADFQRGTVVLFPLQRPDAHGRTGRAAEAARKPVPDLVVLDERRDAALNAHWDRFMTLVIEAWCWRDPDCFVALEESLAHLRRAVDHDWS